MPEDDVQMKVRLLSFFEGALGVGVDCYVCQVRGYDL